MTADRRRGGPRPVGATRSAADVTRTARVVERVAALVGAGLPPRRALSVVLRREPDATPVDQADDGTTDTASVLEHLRGEGWAEVAALWRVAERIGAPIGPALTAAATALREVADGERAVAVALAGPTASGRVVLALPAFGVLLGLLWGADVLGVLATTPLGWALVSAATALSGIGRAWTRALVARARRRGPVPGLLLETWAVAVSGGAAWPEAQRVVARAVPAPPADEVRIATETLALATEAGVPAATLLRAAAGDVRRQSVAARLAAAERLGVRLVLPLGVCVLPAFVLVGVVPVVVGVFSSTAGSFG